MFIVAWSIAMYFSHAVMLVSQGPVLMCHAMHIRNVDIPLSGCEARKLCKGKLLPT